MPSKHHHNGRRAAILAWLTANPGEHKAHDVMVGVNFPETDNPFDSTRLNRTQATLTAMRTAGLIEKTGKGLFRFTPTIEEPVEEVDKTNVVKNFLDSIEINQSFATANLADELGITIHQLHHALHNLKAQCHIVRIGQGMYRKIDCEHASDTTVGSNVRSAADLEGALQVDIDEIFSGAVAELVPSTPVVHGQLDIIHTFTGSNKRPAQIVRDDNNEVFIAYLVPLDA